MDIYEVKAKLELVSKEAAGMLDVEKNIEIFGESKKLGSRDKLWFRCSKGHSFDKRLDGIVDAVETKSKGCPYCSGRVLKAGYNDLESQRPDLLEYWDYANNAIKPSEISVTDSYRPVSWKCDKGHSFETTVNRFIEVKSKGNSGCPYCHGLRASEGYNDLKTIYPAVAELWDTEKNGCGPESVTYGSAKKCWFICKNGHSYQQDIQVVLASIHSTCGCAICSGKRVVPGVNDFGSQFPELLKYWNYNRNGFSPSEVLSNSNTKELWWVCEKGHSFKRTPLSMTDVRFGSCPVCNKANDVSTDKLPSLVKGENYGEAISPRESRNDLEEKGKQRVFHDSEMVNPIKRQIKSRAKRGINDILTLAPEVTECIDWEKESKDIDLSEIHCGSHKRLWFKCKNGHSFVKEVGDWYRARKTSTKGCPYCKGIAVLSGDNDFESVYPELMHLWDWKKNIVLPSKIIAGDNRNRYWFVCNKGHSYKTSTYNVIRGKNSFCGCSICAGLMVESGSNDFESQHPELMYLWDWNKNTSKPSEVLSTDKQRKFWFICSNGHSYRTTIDTVVNSPFEGCIFCSHTISSGNLELKEYVESLGLEVKPEEPLPSKKRLDLFVSDKNFAIEFNGLYWHREEKVGKNHHREKYLECLKQGIQLFNVWEDDWNNRPEVVKKILAYKLGVSDERKANARDCSVVELDTGFVKDFLEENHIQGYASGSFYIGLQDKDLNIVSVIVCKFEQGGLNIIRYATCCSVRGGFSKLVKYIESNFNYPFMYTFSDNGVSDGGLYSKNGFERADELEPDYMYVYKGKRHHKFGFRKDRFKRDPELEWREGMTEKELAELNGIDRVWDAGKIRWVRRNPNYIED